MSQNAEHDEHEPREITTLRPLAATLPDPSERERPVRIAVGIVGACALLAMVGIFVFRQPDAAKTGAAAQPPAPQSTSIAKHEPAPPPPAAEPAPEPAKEQAAPAKKTAHAAAPIAPAKASAPATPISAPAKKPALTQAVAKKPGAAAPAAGDEDLAALANMGAPAAAPPPPPAAAAPPAAPAE